MVKLIPFLSTSSLLGLRRDLVQAGGGNTSIKIDNTLYIKASGICLYDMSEIEHISKVSMNNAIIDFNRLSQISEKSLRDKEAKSVLERLSPKPIPSMETFMHLILGECVFHFHDSRYLALPSSTKLVSSLEGLGLTVFEIEYVEPGLSLAIEIHNLVQKSKSEIDIILLKNHGIIINGCSLESCLEKLVYIDEFFDHKDKSYDIAKYLPPGWFVRKTERIKDISLCDYTPLTPDMVIYIGDKVYSIASEAELEELLSKKVRINVVILNSDVYILARRKMRVLDIEDMLEEYSSLRSKLVPLKRADILSIDSLPLEKNRK